MSGIDSLKIATNIPHEDFNLFFLGTGMTSNKGIDILIYLDVFPTLLS